MIFTVSECQLCGASVKKGGVVEASDLGIPIGRWPNEIHVMVGVEPVTFIYAGCKRDEEGKLESADYRTEDGVCLVVLND